MNYVFSYSLLYILLLVFFIKLEFKLIQMYEIKRNNKGKDYFFVNKDISDVAKIDVSKANFYQINELANNLDRLDFIKDSGKYIINQKNNTLQRVDETWKR